MSEKKNIRRDKIIKSAAKLFFNKGFSNTSIDDIIKITGGSKREIYNEFGNKSGLLSVIIETYTGKVLDGLKLHEFDETNLELSLKKFGYELMKAYFKPEVLGLYTMIFKEAKLFPDLALEFYEKGPLLGATKLSEFLKNCIKDEQLKEHPSDKIANIFISIIRDKIHLKVMLNKRERMNLDEIKNEVDLIVEVFLYGITK